MSCTADQSFKIFGVFPTNFRGCVFTFYLQTKILRLLFYLGRLEIHIALSNPNIDVRESSLRVIMLPSLVYLYFELDIEQDEIRMLIHKQKTE